MLFRMFLNLLKRMIFSYPVLTVLNSKVSQNVIEELIIFELPWKVDSWLWIDSHLRNWLLFFCYGDYAASKLRMVFQSARTVNRNVTVISPKKLATLLVDLTLSLMMELHTQLRGMLMRLDIMLKAPIYRPCPLSNQPHLNQSIHLVKWKYISVMNTGTFYSQ